MVELADSAGLAKVSKLNRFFNNYSLPAALDLLQAVVQRFDSLAHVAFEQTT